MKLKPFLILSTLFLFSISAKADLVFEKENIVGNITVNDTQYTAIYTFTNKGKRDVTIKDVKTSCGCTTANMPKHTYKPGEQGTVEVVFVFGYRRGVQHKDVTLVTDEGVFGGDKVYALNLSVMIPEKYTVSKRSHHWTVGGEATPWSFTIEMNPDWKAKFDSIECRKDAFDYTYVEDAKKHTVTITVTPKETAEKLRDILNVYLSDGITEPKKISIFISIRDTNE